jgi:hypothetical protein
MLKIPSQEREAQAPEHKRSIMSCSLYSTVRGRVRCDKYRSLDDLKLAYEGARDKYRPVWAYDETGALVLGAEPEWFLGGAENR